MVHVSGKLTGEGHVMSLIGQLHSSTGEGKGEWFMVSKNCELVAFDVVEKVFYSQEDGQQLAVKNTVFPFGVSELPREESYWTPEATQKLF